MRSEIFAAVLATALVSLALPAGAATWGELTSGNGNGNANGSVQVPMAAGPYAAGPYAATPQAGTCWQCSPPPVISGGPEGVPPSALDASGMALLPPSAFIPPDAYLPLTRDGRLPAGQTQIWTFGQVNNTTDPFDQTGLSTPFMYVPWSTPLSGWTNAQTWNWWRERAGVRSPLW